ncbi:MAG TPA: serine hydrolase domain-containing protein [Thermoanaerobaculia bacterium]|nr:serine hydrolase domain-containing protein [Thermoanaerobaculia bacterium]
MDQLFQMFARYLLPAVAVLTLAATPAMPADGVRTPLGEKLDAHMSRLEAYGFSGSLLVARGGEVILHKGYGFADAQRKVPFTSDTAFDVGSITKQFTATAILKLEMQGKLSVTDPISKWFEGVPEDKKGITLHHLLTHSAGLEDIFGDDYEEMPRNRLVKTALESKLLWAPGTRYRYSNAGYSLLATVVELASGKPYEVYLQESLWKPTGMTRTGYRLQEKGPLAHGVVGDREDWGTPLDKAWAPDGPWWNLRGNGGVLSTTGDLYKWHQALEGEKILSKEAKAKMFTPHVPEDEEGRSHYGYGWAIMKTARGTRLVSHNGGNGIFNADFRRYTDDGVVLIIGSNRQDFRSIPAVGPITRLIFNADYSAPPAVVKVEPSASIRHAGNYALPSGGKIRVTVVESSSGWPGVTLTPEGKDAFQILAGGAAAADTAEGEKRLLAGLEQSRKGDYALLAEVFGAPVAEVAGQSKETWSRLEGIHGAFQSLDLLGTTSTAGRPTTWVEARFERGKSLMQFGWDGSTVATIQVLDRPPGGVLYLPESGTSFASYDPRTGAVTRIGFEEGAMVLRNAAGEVRAKKEAG